jgi:hypothetical protein
LHNPAESLTYTSSPKNRRDGHAFSSPFVLSWFRASVGWGRFVWPCSPNPIRERPHHKPQKVSPKNACASSQAALSESDQDLPLSGSPFLGNVLAVLRFAPQLHADFFTHAARGLIVCSSTSICRRRSTRS